MAEFHANNSLNIIISPINRLSLAAWNKGLGAGLPRGWSWLQVRLSTKLFFFFVVYIYFRFVFVFVFNHIFPLGLSPSIYTAGPLQPREDFKRDKRISSNVYITLAYSFTAHALPIEIWKTWKVQRKNSTTASNIELCKTKSKLSRHFSKTYAYISIGNSTIYSDIWHKYLER